MSGKGAVTLRTGSEVPESLLRVVMMSLEAVQERGVPGLLALRDVALLARGAINSLPPQSAQILKGYGLLVQDSLRDATRAIVLAAVSEDGSLRSPLP